jgi:hypothetical protein
VASTIKVEIIGDASSLEKATKDAEKSVGKLDDAVGKVDDKGIRKLDGAIGDLARDRLGPLGGLAESVGMDLGGMSASTLAAGAAVAGLGAFVASGVRQLGTMTDEVRKFRDSSGLSWETSSRLVATMDDLGVSAETGAAAMGRLAKNIDAGKLEEFGLSAVRAKDGTVDMAATLGNVADAMIRTQDPTKRAAMGTALFGKSWADLMPYLEQGGKGIRAAMADVADYQIVSAETAQQQRELSLATDALADAWHGLQTEAAKSVVPALTGAAEAGSVVLDGLNSIGSWLQQHPTIGSLVSPWFAVSAEAKKSAADAKELTGDMAEAVDTAGVSAEQAAAKVKELADREREAARDAAAAAKATDAYRKAVDEMAMAAMGSVGSQLNYYRAQVSVRDGLEKVTEAQQAAEEAASEYGRKAPEFVEKQKDYESAILDSIGAMDALAKAEVDKRVELAAGSQGTLTATEKTQIYTQKMHELGSQISDPTMRALYDEFIAKTDAAAQKADAAAKGQEAFNTQMSLVGRALGSVGEFTDALPTDAQAAAFERIAAAARETASALAELGIDTTPAYLAPGLEPLAGRNADGGPVAAGRTYLVGEQGPELFTPNQSGGIVPNSMLGGGGRNVTINVNSPIGRPDEVVRWMRDELRRLDRGHR